MKKKFKLAFAIFSAIALASYAYAWYSNISIPAWQAFVWCWFVFWQDLDNYSREH